MTKNIISVKKDSPIYEVVELLVKHNFSGMPVVDDDTNLLGVLSEKDLIILYYGLKDDENKTVADFMTQPPTHLDQDVSLLDVCDFLMKNIYRRIPITSNRKLVGIITVKDILQTILQSRREKINIGLMT